MLTQPANESSWERDDLPVIDVRSEPEDLSSGLRERDPGIPPVLAGAIAKPPQGY